MIDESCEGSALLLEVELLLGDLLQLFWLARLLRAVALLLRKVLRTYFLERDQFLVAVGLALGLFEKALLAHVPQR